jgi:hypothetical protein
MADVVIDAVISQPIIHGSFYGEARIRLLGPENKSILGGSRRAVEA